LIDGKYRAQIREHGKKRHLGTFATPEEAALCYARHIGEERVAAEVAEARVERPRPLTADEARAAAAAEGLELATSSSSETGFKGVTKTDRMYQAHIKADGKHRHLGIFETPEEASLCYARFVAAARAAAGAAEARDGGSQLLAVDEAKAAAAAEARAAAAAEGLELVPSSSGETGFKGVTKSRDKFAAKVGEDGKARYLGIYETPEEAALCCARFVAAARAAGEAAQARGKGPRSLTADEARAAAAAEGLELVPSSSSETGFKGVTKNHDKYAAKIRENGKQRSLGNFSTPEEAALYYARFVKEGGGVTEAAEARGDAEAVDGVRRGRDRGWGNADAEDGVRKCGTPGCTLAAGHIGLCDSECTSGKRRHRAPSAECTSGKRRHRAHDSAPSAEGTRGKRRHSAPSAVPRQPRTRSRQRPFRSRLGKADAEAEEKEGEEGEGEEEEEARERLAKAQRIEAAPR
jgi:hypothetical protein